MSQHQQSDRPSESRSSNGRIRMIAMLPSLGQPRYAKRVDSLKNLGFDPTVLAFEREYHTGRVPNCPTVIIGKAVESKYVSRLFSIIRAWPEVRRRIRHCDIVYAFGVDMAFLALSARLFRSVPIVLEIGDVVPVQVSSSWRGKCFRIFDKFLTARCQLIVTTTPKFLSEYYQKRLKVRTPGIVLENKVEADFGSGVRAKLESSPPPAVSAARICIGYFGLLGCPWAFEVLKTLVTQHPDRFEVVLSGLRWPTVDLDKYLASTPGFRYTGQFKSPQDLPALYGGVDVTWACYPPIGPSDWNLHWARPNRFYESCLFCVPLISRAGSCDAVDVANYKIGHVVDSIAVQDAADDLAKNLTSDNIAKWKENMRTVPVRVYQYTTEFDDLASAMKKLVDHSQMNRSLAS